MSSTSIGRSRVWSIVLAGGEGERIRPLIQRWLGHHLPKQYCAFTGTRSMFQHTLDRADQLTSGEYRVVVSARSHQREVFQQLKGRAAGTVLLQPANRGTAAGIFLPLSYIRTYDPDAMVAIYPSDQFICPENRLLETLQRAVWATKWLGDRLIILGATPTDPEVEYGWIHPGQHIGWTVGFGVRSVRSFLEKPDITEASAAWRAGALWNTMMIVGKVSTLWNLGRRCCPDLMPVFERIGQAVGSPQQELVVDEAYQHLPAHDFSRDILQQAPDQLATIQLRDVIWSDWGKAERIVETLRRIGRRPAFPLDSVPADPAAALRPGQVALSPG